MSTEGQFIRIYKRASQSPWDDHSTIMLLANASKNGEEIELDFSRYIYLHRDVVGRILGLSLSKTITAEADFSDERYVSDEMMYVILLTYIDEITAFCELYSEDFESIFLAKPAQFFASFAEYWAEKLE